jgi:hypothetical protein
MARHESDDHAEDESDRPKNVCSLDSRALTSFGFGPI